MSTRSAHESVVRIFEAFRQHPSWTQAALAREVGIGAPALRRLLGNMEREGIVPLQRETEHPHVYWSVPRGWVPGGVVFEGRDVQHLLRLLVRAPKSPEREGLIRTAARCVRHGQEMADSLVRIVHTPDVPPKEREHEALIESSAAEQTALHMRYYSTRGREGWRHVSVQRVMPGPPGRFLGVCHRSGDLRWWRVGNVLAAELAPGEPFRAARAAELEAAMQNSIGGFFERGPARALSFTVRDPEARWVAKNLLEGMRVETLSEGVRVQITTAALPIVARFVVGLGGAAQVETAELREAVCALAQGALASNPPQAPAPRRKKRAG